MPKLSSLELFGRLKTRANVSFDLADAFANDPRRADTFCASFGGLYVDYSKQLIDQDTWTMLLDLAHKRHLSEAIARLMSGQEVNATEKRPALHTALRMPAHSPLCHKGQNITQEVHAQLERMYALADKIRAHLWFGYSGKCILDVVNIGVGGSDLGPLMVTSALDEWADTKVRVHFVSNMDGTQLHRLLLRLDPERTLFVISSKSFDTIDTMANAKTAKHWLMRSATQHYADLDAILPMLLRQHFIGISAHADKMRAWGIDEAHQIRFWEFVGGRFSLWSGIGLAIVVRIGCVHFKALLSGAHAMDCHFSSAPFAHNLPVILGLIGVYNSTFLDIRAQAVLPYDGRLMHFPSYLTQLEMESNGKSVDTSGCALDFATCPVIWGEVGSNAQHAFYQLLHQGTQRISSDFIAPVRRYIDHPDLNAQHKTALANCLAQAHVLAFGTPKRHKMDPHQSYVGNQPSTTILLDALTPATLGSLIALYEHKVYVMATLWDINPFDQWGVEMGKIQARTLEGTLTASAPPKGLDGSTARLIAFIKDASL